MNMKDDARGAWDRVREAYNAPAGDIPREAMWTEIARRIDASEGDRSADSADLAGHGVERRSQERDRTAHVVDLAAERAARTGSSSNLAVRRIAGWSVAAAALLVLGMGIGRMTAPASPVAESAPATTATNGSSGIGLAAREHLGRTESLLTMVRADARDGQVDPAVAGWAEDLLAQTRLLLDRREGVDPELRDLLMDLELVLVQVVGVAGTGSLDDARARTEVELTLRSLDEGEVLPRIQATLPMTMSGA